MQATQLGDDVVAGDMSTTAGPKPTVKIERYDAESVENVLADVTRLYEVIYQEPPYCEGPDDVNMFVEGMPRRIASPAFRLTLAAVDGVPVGFAFGHQLVPDTKWWQGATTDLPDDVSREYPGRTFAIIELAAYPPPIGRESVNVISAGAP
jgi:hypothetical protein